MLSNPPPTCKQRTCYSGNSNAKRTATCDILIQLLINRQAWNCARNRSRRKARPTRLGGSERSRKPPRRRKIAAQHRENDLSSALLGGSDGGIPLPLRMIYRYQSLNGIYCGCTGKSGVDRSRIRYMMCLRDRHRFACRPRRRREAVGRGGPWPAIGVSAE